MNCPHCGAVKSKVFMTRRGQGAVWRRRTCLSCNLNFVSREEAPPTLQMPKSVEKGTRADAGSENTYEHSKQPKFKTDHLKGIW